MRLNIYLFLNLRPIIDVNYRVQRYWINSLHCKQRILGPVVNLPVIHCHFAKDARGLVYNFTLVQNVQLLVEYIYDTYDEYSTYYNTLQTA